MQSHEGIDARSLAMDRLIAAKVRTEPELLSLARANVARWLADCSGGVRPALEEWKGILGGSVEDVVVVLEGVDERSRRLRQSSPFCGMLTAGERTEIFLEFEKNEARSA